MNLNIGETDKKVSHLCIKEGGFKFELGNK